MTRHTDRIDGIDGIEIRQDGPDEVLCAGCAQPGIDVVIGDSDTLTAWHADCLTCMVRLPAPFYGTWDELEALLPSGGAS